MLFMALRKIIDRASNLLKNRHVTSLSTHRKIGREEPGQLLLQL